MKPSLTYEALLGLQKTLNARGERGGYLGYSDSLFMVLVADAMHASAEATDDPENLVDDITRQLSQYACKNGKLQQDLALAQTEIGRLALELQDIKSVYSQKMQAEHDKATAQERERCINILLGHDEIGEWLYNTQMKPTAFLENILGPKP